MTETRDDAPPELPGVTHRWVEANGVKLHVAEAGPADGEPLLLLHGWPQHWYMWRKQIPELSKRYRVIAPDLRGFGWSDAPDTSYEKERLADDMLALLDVLQLQRVHFMAHDWGGWIGFLMCIRAPGRFTKFLALNIPHPFQRFRWSSLKNLWRFWYQWLIATPYLGAWVVRARRGLIYVMMKRGYYLERQTPGAVESFCSRLRQPARAWATVRLYRQFQLEEFPAIARGRYRNARLTTPTLILFGRRDVAISTDLLQGHEQNADDLRIEFVDGAGHFVAEDAPAIVTKRALEFFAS